MSKKANKSTVTVETPDTPVSYVEKTENVEAPKAESKLTKSGHAVLTAELAQAILASLATGKKRAEVASEFNVHPSTVANVAGGSYYVRDMYDKAGKQFPTPETSPRYTRSGVKSIRASKKHSEAYNAVVSEAKARLDAAIATARNEYNQAIEQAQALDAAQVEQAKAEQAKAQAAKAQVESAKLQARIATETAKMEKMQARIDAFTASK